VVDPEPIEIYTTCTDCGFTIYPDYNNKTKVQTLKLGDVEVTIKATLKRGK
jgi:hypothetical protein